MKVMIIGGAGYIGSHVTLECLDAGHQVTVFDNLSSGLEQNLFPSALFIKGDILDTSALANALGTGYDAIVHLAAFKAAGESMLAPEKYSINNICGTINILNAAAAAGVKYLVFSSSAAIYGEPEYLPLDERHPTNPTNYYGFTKLEIERILAWYGKLKGLRYACLRYFNAAGYDTKGRVSGLEKNPANLLPLIMETACGMREELKIFGNDYQTKDGTGVRDYVHVNDLAAAHVAALSYLKRTDTDLAVNLGSGAGLSVMELIEAARLICQKPIPSRVVQRRPGDPAGLYASAALAKNLLGWEAVHSDIETLISTSWAAYKKSN